MECIVFLIHYINYILNLRFYFFFLFLAFDFCRFWVVIRFFQSQPQRPMTSDFEGFLSQIVSITFLSYLNSPESISLFNVECQTRKLLVPFITSLVWRGPWLGIEPGISRTRSQHSTTRLSKRRLSILYNIMYLTKLRHSNTFISLYVTYTMLSGFV